MRTLDPLLLLALTIGPLAAAAATHEEVMQSRYLKYSFCMQRELGQLWWKKERVALGMNRWGVSEPTEESNAQAAPKVLKSDRSCRENNKLQAEPRPNVPLAEKNLPD